MDRTAFSILGNRDYRMWFAGQAAFLFSNKAQGVAITWLAYAESGSVSVLGTVAALTMLPMLALGPVGGMLADRFDERHVVMATQAAFAMTALVMGALQVSGLLSLPLILPFAFLIGVISGLDNGPRPALVQRIVADRALLPKAIALNALAFHASRFIGPAMAGILVASAGAGVCFLVNALFSLPLLFILLRLEPAEEKVRHSEGAGLSGGFAYALAHTETRILLGTLCCVGLLSSPYIQMLPWFVREVFSGNAAQYGCLFAATGLGSFLASMFVAVLGPSGNPVQASLRSFAAGSALVAGFAETPFFWLAAAILLAAGFFFTHGMVSLSTRIQTTVPPHLRGRVLALISMAGIGTMPLGSLMISGADSSIGAQTALAAGSLLTAGLSLLLWRRQACVKAEGGHP